MNKSNLGASLQTIESLIATHKLKKFDEAKVRYHDMKNTPTPESPGHCDFTNTKECAWILEPLPATTHDGVEFNVLVSHMASAIPVAVWFLADHVSLTWHVKCTVMGLSPVRPLVVLKTDVTIPPASAVLVAGQ